MDWVTMVDNWVRQLSPTVWPAVWSALAHHARRYERACSMCNAQPDVEARPCGGAALGNRSVRLTLLGRRVSSLPALAPKNEGKQHAYNTDRDWKRAWPVTAHDVYDDDGAEYDGANDQARHIPFRRSLVFCHGLLPEGVL